ncbi:hypothetical protein L6164_006426 [Bauhinia variegata]|uniref:Uncharacterized protein n=1 Tax=Bauhinia variegata TaxID=167791 RepID=A0ACB9PUH2_BAUVA|nr:hypothetical protein L6164_006426 [Bauhinia variegata]
MQRESDLWDYSALLRDYYLPSPSCKVIDSNKNKDHSAAEAEHREKLEAPKDINSNNQFENPERRSDTDGKDYDLLTDAPDSGETSNISSLEVNHPVDQHAGQPCLDTTSNQNIQSTPDVQSGNLDGQAAYGYARSLFQCYELLKERQQLLEELKRHGVSNYPADAFNFVSSSYLDGTCVGRTCNDDSIPACLEKLDQDNKILKTARGATERAISAIRTSVSGDSYMKGENERKWSELDQCTEAEHREKLEAPEDINSNNEFENPERRRHRDTDGKDNVLLTDPHAGQPCLDTTSNQNIQGTPDVQSGYLDGHVADDYTQLLIRCNELVEERQKVLEQLNHYGNWNYQYPTDASYFVAGRSLDGTHVGKTCNDDSIPTCPEKVDQDNKILKTAMGAAEIAMSAIRTSISGDSNMKGEIERKHSDPDQCADSETDLTDLFYAWYSAGFYTGKYLAEQSMANRRQK